MIEELLTLLSCNELSSTELSAGAEFVRNAPENSELSWLESPQQMMTFAVFDQLHEYIADSDKFDELHEQLEAMFADPLPPFPFKLAAEQQGSFAYFRWLDEILSKRAPLEGGYELISIDPGVDDHLRVLVVYRRDVQRILSIAQTLSLRISRQNGSE